MAAEHPEEVSAVVAFSPGEYLEHGNAIAQAAAQVQEFGGHDASTLIEARDPNGATQNWIHALGFLNALPPPHS